MPTLKQIRDMAARGKMAPLFGGNAAYVTPVTPERALYNEILQKYQDAPDDLAILPSDLISECVLNTSTQKIEWFLRADQANPTNAIRRTEIRLETRDSFCADMVGLMFGNELITAAATPSRIIMQQWPNPATAALGGFETNSPGIASAFQGKMSATVNTVNYLKNLSAQRFQYVEFLTRGSLIFTASNTPFNTFGGNRGFANLTPSMDVKGSDTSQFVLAMPDSFDFSTLALNQVVARLILRGMLIQGGAQYEF